MGFDFDYNHILKKKTRRQQQQERKYTAVRTFTKFKLLITFLGQQTSRDVLKRYL